MEKNEQEEAVKGLLKASAITTFGTEATVSKKPRPSIKAALEIVPIAVSIGVAAGATTYIFQVAADRVGILELLIIVATIVAIASVVIAVVSHWIQARARSPYLILQTVIQRAFDQALTEALSQPSKRAPHG